MINKFIKKPIPIEAIQLVETKECLKKLKEFCKPREFIIEPSKNKDEFIYIIETLEGNHKADVGDWIIKGIEGECYPCKEYIFNKSYDLYKKRLKMKADRYEQFLKEVKINGLFLKNIDEPSYELCKEAVTQNGLAIEYSPFKTRELHKIAIDQNVSSIQYIAKPCNAIIYHTLKKSGLAIMHIQKATDNMKFFAISHYPEAIRCIHDKSKDMILEAYRRDGSLFSSQYDNTSEMIDVAKRQREQEKVILVPRLDKISKRNEKFTYEKLANFFDEDNNITFKG